AGVHLVEDTSGADVPSTISVTGNDDAVIIHPNTPLAPDTTYLVEVDASVTDQARNAAEPFTSFFQTSPDPASAAVRVVAVAPTDGAVNVPLNTHVAVRFSKPVDPATITANTFQVSN